MLHLLNVFNILEVGFNISILKLAFQCTFFYIVTRATPRYFILLNVSDVETE